MTRKVFLILLALVLTLSVGLVACTEPAEEEEEEEELVPEEWNTAVEAYNALADQIPFYSDLTALADWLNLPVEPEWLKSATISTTGALSERSGTMRVVVNGAGKTISVDVSRNSTGGAMVCSGGDEDYEITRVVEGGGELETVLIEGGDSTRIIKWMAGELGTTVAVTVDGETYTEQWPAESDPAALKSFCESLIDWLTSHGKGGGLISLSDQPYLMLAEGAILYQPPYNGNVGVLASVGKAILADILMGIFGTIGYLLI